MKSTEVIGLVERLRAQKRATQWTRGLDADYATAWEPEPLAQEAADEIERLRVDANRYRWLRDGNAYAPEEVGVVGGDELDKLIDEAAKNGRGRWWA